MNGFNLCLPRSASDITAPEAPAGCRACLNICVNMQDHYMTAYARCTQYRFTPSALLHQITVRIERARSIKRPKIAAVRELFGPCVIGNKTFCAARSSSALVSDFRSAHATSTRAKPVARRVKCRRRIASTTPLSVVECHLSISANSLRTPSLHDPVREICRNRCLARRRHRCGLGCRWRKLHCSS